MQLVQWLAPVPHMCVHEHMFGLSRIFSTFLLFQIFTVIDAMADGAVKQGVPRQMALQFAAQTVLGAAKMVLQSGKHPAVLKDEVCSPGGTTICGIHELEKAGVRNAFINAIEKAAEKSAELTKKH